MCNESGNQYLWHLALSEFVVNMTPQEQEEIVAVDDLKPYLHQKLCGIIDQWKDTAVHRLN